MFHRINLTTKPLIIVALLSGSLYPLGFAPFHFWPLTIVSMLALLLLLDIGGARRPFLLGWCWGLAMNLVGCSWVYVSIHRFGGAPWWGAGCLTLLFVAYLALFKGLTLFLFAKMVTRRVSFFYLMMAFAALWLFGEWLQSTLLTGFPWLLAGYSQTDGPLVVWATLGGVYLVSWLIAFFVAACWWLLRDGQKPFLAATPILVVAVLTAVLPSPQRIQRDEALQVALVQPSVPQAIKWQRSQFVPIVDELYTLSEKHWGSDLIVWPEGAVPAYYQSVPALMEDLSQRAQQSGTTLLLGIPYYRTAEKRSFVAVASLGAKQQFYFKQVLVPFGEYVPLEDWLRGLIAFFDLPMSAFSLPTEEQHPLVTDKFTLIPAICYEIAYPSLIRELLSKQRSNVQPNVLVTVSNDAWFGDSLGPYQHKQMARLRAIELGIPLLRSTNDGITFAADAKGQVLAELPRYAKQTLQVQVNTSEVVTPYRQMGATIPLVLTTAGLLFALFTILGGRRQVN